LIFDCFPFILSLAVDTCATERAHLIDLCSFSSRSSSAHPFSSPSFSNL